MIHDIMRGCVLFLNVTWRCRVLLFLFVSGLFVLVSGCQPSGDATQDKEEEASGSEPEAGPVSQSVALDSDVNDEVEVLPISSAGGTRSRGQADRSVGEVLRREVLPEMGESTGSYHLLSIGVDEYLDWPALQFQSILGKPTFPGGGSRRKFDNFF